MMDRFSAYRADEAEIVGYLLQAIKLSSLDLQAIQNRAQELVIALRSRENASVHLEAFFEQYDLSTAEGMALMCVAEALLRIPDVQTRNELIADKITMGDWQLHLGKSKSWLVNTMTRGLMWGDQLLESQTEHEDIWRSLCARTTQAPIRWVVTEAMRLLGHQFVLGETIESALKHAKQQESKGYRYSYDMLGESARTDEDAERYFQAYDHAIEQIGSMGVDGDLYQSAGLSIKLSALHPRYEFLKTPLLHGEWLEKLMSLVLKAKAQGVSLTIDAEESERLDLSLGVFEKLFRDPRLGRWEGLGLALQAYQKRAFWVIDLLADWASQQGKRIAVRLVKGAYWDSEIKRSQVMGFKNYPVFTRKVATDVSYLACAQKLFEKKEHFYLQYATHNVHTVSALLEMAGDFKGFEFQRLQGMGEALYEQLRSQHQNPIPCRIYAPVGSHQDLLAYLVRRLLENGANSSFVNQLSNPQIPVATLIADPVSWVRKSPYKPHPKIPLPQDLWGMIRSNSNGVDLTHQTERLQLLEGLKAASQTIRLAGPIVGGVLQQAVAEPIRLGSPFAPSLAVGEVIEADTDGVERALFLAERAFKSWSRTPVLLRQNILKKLAQKIEENRSECVFLLIREGGKTIPNALSEIREAIDFCHYYAAIAEIDFGKMKMLPSPTGELNHLGWMGRGPVVCISPWNFPLAIFVGQMVAALVAGNTVLVKPAEQTPLIAYRVIEWLLEVGLPSDVIHFLPGRGEIVGAHLVSDERVKAVVFTGATETARSIHRALAERKGPIVPLVAETGGINAMIADSSALLEQLVSDVCISAFDSAGQRCSSLRVLYLQEEIFDRTVDMLIGAMKTLVLGDPTEFTTDIGPVIDQAAWDALNEHKIRMKKEAVCLFEMSLDPFLKQGYYFAPCLFKICHINQIKTEVFGPILHLISYKVSELDSLIDSINQTGYGLTFGIHSRVVGRVQFIRERIAAGNVYVNRNMIGAVVGVQPFGGLGLSGTGPKAGGSDYLRRLAVEYTWTEDTTAAGGNASLLCLSDA